MMLSSSVRSCRLPSRLRNLLLVFSLLAAGGLIGCDSSSTTGPDSSEFAGTYSGTTEQGKSITFTVRGDGGDVYISSFSFGIELNEPVSPPGGVGGCLSFFADTDVSANVLRHDINPAGFRVLIPEDVPFLSLLPIDVTWDGSLTAAGTAGGVILAEQDPNTGFGGCGGRGLATWTATRN